MKTLFTLFLFLSGIFAASSNYENKLKEYFDYLNSVNSDLKIEESEYREKIRKISDKISSIQYQLSTVKKQKKEFKDSLSKDCREYIAKKLTYENELANMLKKNTKNINRKNTKRTNTTEQKK